jgi:hypothetical protein
MTSGRSAARVSSEAAIVIANVRIISAAVLRWILATAQRLIRYSSMRASPLEIVCAAAKRLSVEGS